MLTMSSSLRTHVITSKLPAISWFYMSLQAIILSMIQGVLSPISAMPLERLALFRDFRAQPYNYYSLRRWKYRFGQ